MDAGKNVARKGMAVDPVFTAQWTELSVPNARKQTKVQNPCLLTSSNEPTSNEKFSASPAALQKLKSLR